MSDPLFSQMGIEPYDEAPARVIGRAMIRKSIDSGELSELHCCIRRLYEETFRMEAELSEQTRLAKHYRKQTGRWKRRAMATVPFMAGFFLAGAFGWVMWWWVR